MSDGLSVSVVMIPDLSHYFAEYNVMIRKRNAGKSYKNKI